MKRCKRCGRYIDDDAKVCFDCGYGENLDKIEYCPKCGRELIRGACKKCDYQKRGLKNICPECGRAIVDGVCKKCGYRYKESDKTCPYCGGKLVNNFCYKCKYKRGETFKYIIVIIICIIIGIIFFARG